MKFESYDHAAIEPAVLTYWQNQKVVESLRDRNRGKEKFYFLDGPPYTSGRIHLGHAWNKALKDMVLRYKRMRQFDVWDRAGFDMHGLPTEHKVMAKHNLKTKEDIEKFGLDNFARECRSFCTEMMQAMIADFERIGTTLDYSDPYQPIKTSYTNAVWGLIRKAHDDNRLYLGERTLHWDPKDQSALAKHELFYKSVQDMSIYVKFRVAGKESEYLVIWTTTPWTIPYNLFVMVNPKLTYCKVKVQGDILIMAKNLVEPVMELVGHKYTIVDEFPGEQLGGIKYDHFWADEIPGLKTDLENVHTVLLNEEYVSDSDGTGIVHGAPGCGPEDYEVGHLHKIPPFNTLDESGVVQDAGKFSGLRARYDDPKFIASIEEADALLAKKSYTHDYPHGERSKEPVIFRTTPQWFLKVEDLKQSMVEANESVHWVPTAGKNAFRSWLENLRDNSITKQRFWGTAAPIWKSDDGEIHVIGSVDELKELAKGDVPEDLHKPWIDDVVIVKDGKEYRRIPDVLDVWIDPGCASWTCLYYPEQRDLLERWYVADFIVEGKDQIRAWFNLLFICSYLYFGKPSFQNVFMHGMLNDVDGVKMSKSLGNIISPYEIIDKHGADVVRYYMVQTSAGEDVNFSWDECALKQRNLRILWNVHKLVLTMADEMDCNPFQLPSHELAIEERYIMSKLHSTIKEVTHLLDEYRLDEVVEQLETLYLELSRTYIQMVRDKISSGSTEEKETCLATISTVLLETLKMFQIISPFVCEAIYLNLREQFKLAEDSISQYTWPAFDMGKIDLQLEKQTSKVQSIVQAALHAREKAKLGLRWPVQSVLVVSSDEHVATAVDVYQDVLLRHINTKEISVVPSIDGVVLNVKPNFSLLGPKFGQLSPRVIAEISKTDPATLLAHFDKVGYYEFDIDGNTIRVTKDMVSIEQEAPSGYESGQFREGYVYLDTARTDQLEQEGYVRELVRHIQSVRKNAGLAKTDLIHIHIQTEETFLGPYCEGMQQKVSAEKLTVSNAVEGQEKGSCTIKGKEFTICFK